MTPSTNTTLFSALALSVGLAGVAHAQSTGQTNPLVLAQAQPPLTEQEKAKRKEQEHKGPPPGEKKGPPEKGPLPKVLNPTAPGSSVAIYFALEGGQDYYLGRSTDSSRIGVRAVDDRTVEFRLVAPAPYFMGVMNRPDGGPQPRHAVERDGDAWVEPDRQVVSGAYRIALTRPPSPTELTLALNATRTGSLVDFTHVLLNVNEFVYTR